MEDVLVAADQCAFLLLAAEDDRWSRGARDIQARTVAAGATHVRVESVPGRHEFLLPQRERSYAFLTQELAGDHP